MNRLKDEWVAFSQGLRLREDFVIGAAEDDEGLNDEGLGRENAKLFLTGP